MLASFVLLVYGNVYLEEEEENVEKNEMLGERVYGTEYWQCY